MRNPTIRWGIAVTLGAGLAAGWTGSAGIAEAQSADVLLAGTITDAAGEPLEGVVVSVRASGSAASGAPSAGGAIRYDPETRTATEYRNPIQRDRRGSAGTYGMAGDRDGNGWLSQYGFDVMVKHEHATGESYSVQLPQSPYAPPDDLFVGDDRRIFDTMGGSLFHGRGHPWMHTIRKPGGGEPSDAAWGPGWTSDHLVKIDIETHAVTLYPFPYRDGGCYQAVVDLDGIVWTVFTNADAVGRFDPGVGGVDVVRPAHGRHRVARTAGGDRRRPDAGRRAVLGLEQDGEARVPDRG